MNAQRNPKNDYKIVGINDEMGKKRNGVKESRRIHLFEGPTLDEYHFILE